MAERSGKVAIVTGASRGVGKGVALALGEAGYRVYLTGRTTVEGAAALPGTIGATAAEVAARGGEGIPVACDHADDAQVEALFERVAAETPGPDLLVNNVFAVHDQVLEPGGFWEKSLDMWSMNEVGLRSHYVASAFAARQMVPRRNGLIVNISGYGARAYIHGVAYGVSKAGSDKMVHDMAKELRRHDVAAVSLWLGLVATERTQKALDEHPELFAGLELESPEFPGRVIRALAADPERMKRSGQALIAAELAREYGVTDVDGSSPPSLRDSLGGP